MVRTLNVTIGECVDLDSVVASMPLINGVALPVVNAEYHSMDVPVTQVTDIGFHWSINFYFTADCTGSRSQNDVFQANDTCAASGFGISDCFVNANTTSVKVEMLCSAGVIFSNLEMII